MGSDRTEPSRRSARRALAAIPGPPLWSLPRQGLTGLRRPHELARDLRRRYGEVVRLGPPGSAYVYLFGEEANALVLLDRSVSFTWAEVMAPLEPIVGPTALIVSDGEDHRRRRRLVQPAFATRRIDAAVPVLVAEIDALIDSLPIGVALDLYGLYRAAVRRIVVRVLFGDAPVGLADQLGAALEPATVWVDRPGEFQVPLTPLWWRARRGRRQAENLVDVEIARRREGGELGSDVLGVFLATELSADEIRDQVISLIAAGYETTSAAVAWVVLELLAHPREWDACRDEARSHIGESAPSPEDLRAMPRLGAVINETLRLWPAAVLGRTSSQALSYGGYDLPAGTKILISPFVTHRSPECWGEDADEFRPERWSDDEPPTERYFPFGGPYRHCLGFGLALTEIQVAVVRLLQRVTLERHGPDNELRAHGLSALRPDGGVPVIITGKS